MPPSLLLLHTRVLVQHEARQSILIANATRAAQFDKDDYQAWLQQEESLMRHGPPKPLTPEEQAAQDEAERQAQRAHMQMIYAQQAEKERQEQARLGQIAG